jgi:DNA-binding transcriptional ArsR family regulator
MSARRRSQALSARALRRHVPVFAALGDETRLSLLLRLGQGRPLSISQLTEGTQVTRQAVSKHLRVLERAGVVRPTRQGRERIYALEAKPLNEARASLEAISRQWADALGRLKAFVES